MRHGSTRIVLAGVLVAAAALSTGFAATDPAPVPGTWAGEGTWIGADGREGSYAVEVTVTETGIDTRYAYEHEGKRDQTERVVLIPRGPGFFDLGDDSSVVIGRMACHRGACVVTLERKGASFTETMRLGPGNRLERRGTKDVGGYSVTWRESLDAR